MTPRGDGTGHLMRQTLTEGLSRLRGRPVRIHAMRREFQRSSSSFRTERLRVTLDRGRPLRIFFKDLNPDHQMPKARAVRAVDLEPSRRELEMYRHVLVPERLGTLHLYAFRWQPALGRYWIFLEDGGRTVLHNYLDMPRWTAAARWLARFQVATRELPEASLGFLPRFDAAHYRRCAEQVEQVLPGMDAEERALVACGLARFRESIDWLAALPQCVIHGQFFGKNILLRGRAGAQRVCVIDWETAALGPAMFDLVSLTSGKWTAAQRGAMRRAYVEQYEAETGQPVDEVAMQQEFGAVALYQALEWIAWWGHQRALSRHFANFLRELAALVSLPRAS
jgi:hypothetical protein